MPLYTNSTPGSAEILANSQPLMLANTLYLQESIGVDHNFTNDTTTIQDGYHKVIHYVNQVADPVPIANTSQLYTKTVGGNNQLFFEDQQGNIQQLTSVDSNVDFTLFATNTAYVSVPVNARTIAGGWTYLPGGLILQYGQLTWKGSAGFVLVTYPIPFPSGNAAFCIQCTAVVSSSSTGDQTASIRQDMGTDVGFQLGSTSDGNVLSFSWFAIGN